MLSKDLLRGVQTIYTNDQYHDQINIQYLTENTNDIKKESCFICIKGKHFDSHELITQLKIQPSLIIASHKLDTSIPYVIVHDTLKTLPLLCANFYNNPSHKLNLIGVTGTDGKTTTSYIIKQLISYNQPCAYIGTNGFIVRDTITNNFLTTPKPIELHKFLSKMVKDDIPYVSLEVSSQGLDLYRVDYLKFKIAIFTNLSHEHLDHHQTMENYFLSKLKLFQMLDEDSYAIINLDSEYAQRIIENTKAKIITYGMHQDAQFQIKHINTSFTKTTFDLSIKDKVYSNINLNLFGDYNVYNTTAALASCYALNFNLDDLIDKLSNLKPIDGRMHFVNCGQPYPIIIDFAHTPNALNSLLKNINQCKNKNLTVVFGSAGERDKTKRPIMGEVVEHYADTIILTSEDPKSEETISIISDIYQGIHDVFKVSIIPNRKKAIYKALDTADSDDIVVITGKGNEKYEKFDGYQIKHNDIEVVNEILKGRF